MQCSHARLEYGIVRSPIRRITGIGKATAYDLARRKARVLLACRNIAKAEKVAKDIRSSTGNENVVVRHLDLCSFESVRKCAKEILETEEKLHILINNAGITGKFRKIDRVFLKEICPF
ncbi:hypothetical protein TNCV_1722091 [Trichonephila clavipes]|nr:hypothetical protein TNCV_1722091 [Trichonephila clavipes]